MADTPPLTPADAPSADITKSRSLTNAERILILKLRDDGLTQVQIAQRLGRSQSTISQTLSDFEDSTDLAKRYFAANALSMAENVVRKGLPRDHNVALAGIGVLKSEGGASVKLLVGISLPGMPSPVVESDV